MINDATIAILQGASEEMPKKERNRINRLIKQHGETANPQMKDLIERDLNKVLSVLIEKYEDDID